MMWTSFPDEILRMAQLMQGVSETVRTSEHLMEIYGGLQSSWLSSMKVQGRNIAVPPPRPKKLQPRDCEVHSAALSFIFEAPSDGYFPPIAEYEVRVEGILTTEETIIELQDHWRLDTDAYAPAAEGEDGERQVGVAREPHPFYHFQRGGRALDDFAGKPNFYPGKISGLGDRDWKGLMQCPGPRIPAFPMDPIMALDFCIGQHDGTVWWALRQSPEYLSLIRTAQERLLCPFIEAIANKAHRRKWLGTMALA